MAINDPEIIIVSPPTTGNTLGREKLQEVSRLLREASTKTGVHFIVLISHLYSGAINPNQTAVFYFDRNRQHKDQIAHDLALLRKLVFSKAETMLLRDMAVLPVLG